MGCVGRCQFYNSIYIAKYYVLMSYDSLSRNVLRVPLQVNMSIFKMLKHLIRDA